MTRDWIFLGPWMNFSWFFLQSIDAFKDIFTTSALYRLDNNLKVDFSTVSCVVFMISLINPNSLDNKGSWRILKGFYCSVTMLRESGLIKQTAYYQKYTKIINLYKTGISPNIIFSLSRFEWILFRAFDKTKLLILAASTHKMIQFSTCLLLWHTEKLHFQNAHGTTNEILFFLFKCKLYILIYI